MTNYNHDRNCPARAFGHSDAAKRVSDTWNLHRIGAPYDSVGKWFAVRMDDGTSDNVLYDNKQDAVRHQHHDEQFYAFLCVKPFTLDYCTAEVYLVGARKLHDAGLRMTDPAHASGGPDVIRRSSWEDQAAQSLFLVNQNLILPNQN